MWPLRSGQHSNTPLYRLHRHRVDTQVQLEAASQAASRISSFPLLPQREQREQQLATRHRRLQLRAIATARFSTEPSSSSLPWFWLFPEQLFPPRSLRLPSRGVRELSDSPAELAVYSEYLAGYSF